MTMKRLNDNDDMASPHIERHYCGLSQCYPQHVQGCTDNTRVTRRDGSWYPFKAQELHLLLCLADREDHWQWYLKISINNLLRSRHSVSRTLIPSPGLSSVLEEFINWVFIVSSARPMRYTRCFFVEISNCAISGNLNLLHMWCNLKANGILAQFDDCSNIGGICVAAL